MKNAPHWPRHFHLIGSTQATRAEAATPANMGSKAYHLQQMSAIGLPVPQALVIGTAFTHRPEDCLLPLFSVALPALEAATGLTLGDSKSPLVVSVRSGAPVSMPGMMETLLNVGLSDATLPGLLRQTGNPRLVWDAYRRLIATYGEVVAGLPGQLFEDEMARFTGGRDDRALDFSELRELSQRFLELYRLHAGDAFPQDARDQLSGAVKAVYASWHLPKAAAYRHSHAIDEAIGTAVTIQRMVFGNAGGHSGSGVGFTRHPTDGTPGLWVDFLVNAQGEDVVAGQRNAHGHSALAQVAPDAWSQLQIAALRLERMFGDMQDFEFTIEEGALYLLQTRSGKRTPVATARIALDLMDEGLIDATTARARTASIEDEDLATEQLVFDGGDPTGASAPEGVAEAIAACGGVAGGEVALDIDRVQERTRAGIPVVLVRQDALTSDIAALETAVGLLTQRGARTSHAAVVARQLNKVCLVGCTALRIDDTRRCIQLGEQTIAEGDWITLDGNTGRVYVGKVSSIRVTDEALRQRLHKLRHQRTHDHEPS